jgi:hypothetical protein
MPDRILFPLFGLIAIAMIALALVWPQGLGARSPGPLGRQPVQQTQAVRDARARAKAPPPELPMAPVMPSSASAVPAPNPQSPPAP